MSFYTFIIKNKTFFVEQQKLVDVTLLVEFIVFFWLAKRNFINTKKNYKSSKSKRFDSATKKITIDLIKPNTELIKNRNIKNENKIIFSRSHLSIFSQLLHCICFPF